MLDLKKRFGYYQVYWCSLNAVERALLMACVEDLSRENDKQHLSHPKVRLYGCFHFWASFALNLV